MWSYDIKCKYMFMFPLKNSARKGLKPPLAKPGIFRENKIDSMAADTWGRSPYKNDVLLA